jgi:hypothetical protein
LHVAEQKDYSLCDVRNAESSRKIIRADLLRDRNSKVRTTSDEICDLKGGNAIGGG